jgi:Rrf2 family protein
MALRFTAGARYAAAALVHLASQDVNALVSAEAIAGACDVPRPYLNKVLRSLSVVGIVRGTTGPRGGYALARPAKQITLLEVVETVDGKITGGAEPWRTKTRTLDRRLGPILNAAAEVVRRHLAAVRVSALAGRKPFTFGRSLENGMRQ